MKWILSCLLLLPLLGGSAGAQTVDFQKVMITEVSWGDPDCLEITNFSSGTVNLTGWTVSWWDGSNHTATLNTSIAAGEIIVVRESGGNLPEVPVGTQVLTILPSLSTTSQAFVVRLIPPLVAFPHDMVSISSSGGAAPAPPFPITTEMFRGLAVRGTIAGTGGAVGVERIWRLDSNGGTDWTEQPNRSMGLENRSSGPRGTDPQPIYTVKISETDDNPDYIELRAEDFVNLQGWFLYCSQWQGANHTIIRPFPAAYALSPGEYVVIGDSATHPAEYPTGNYVNLAAVGGGNIPWASNEYDCALYDNYGRLIDLMRTTGNDDVVVHNHPRAPSYWADFVGAAARSTVGDGAVGRRAPADSNTGADWGAVLTRTMGAPNLNNTFAVLSGHGDVFDVRLNEGYQNGLNIIMNAGVSAANYRYSMTISLVHSQGVGPFFGLGGDALPNLFLLQAPPWTGFLDARGSGRIDAPPNTFPPGLDLDAMFFLQDPGGAVVGRTLVLMFDT